MSQMALSAPLPLGTSWLCDAPACLGSFVKIGGRRMSEQASKLVSDQGERIIIHSGR